MESAVIPIPLPKKPTAPGAVIVVDGREVLHTFKDPAFGKFILYKKTTTGRLGFWEEEPAKVQKLIDAFKAGHNIKNSCIYAGITEDAWLRFVEAYPEFRGVKTACESVLSFHAMETVGKALKTKPEIAYKYAEKRGDLNFTPKKVDGDEPLQPTVNVAVQVNNTPNNERAIEEHIRGVRARVIPAGPGEGAGSSNA